nr:DivIVA domain-containing protein [Clostridioides difficile]
MLTPIEIENKEFKKGLRGYRDEEVDEFLDIIRKIMNLYVGKIQLLKKN